MNPYALRFDAALTQRIVAAIFRQSLETRDVRCEVCGDNIHNYQGPAWGIMCNGCLTTGPAPDAGTQPHHHLVQLPLT